MISCIKPYALGVLLLLGSMAHTALAETGNTPSNIPIAPATGAAMPPPFENQTAIGGMPSNRILWVKNPLVTRLGFDGVRTYPPTKDLPLRIEVEFWMVWSNPGTEPIQISSIPTPDGPWIRIRSEGKDILRLEYDDDFSPYEIGPNDDEIRRSTYMRPAGWVSSVKGGYFGLNDYQLLPGTHVYEITWWQSHLNAIDVRNVVRATDTGKGKLRFPSTDNAPSNRIYIKVFAPTVDQADKGKTIQFLGEVDAATQVPRFPYVRPGDFATKTGKWRAIGPSIDELGGGPYEVNVKLGDQMPNLPGDKGVDPFSFLWQFDPDSKDQVSFEDSLKAVKPGQVCPKSGLYEPIKPGQDHYAFTLRTNPDRYRQFKEGDVMPGYFANDEHNADLTWKWLRPPGVYGW